MRTRNIVLAVATVLHLLPRPFGVSPVGALALYAGAHGKRRTAWLLPLVPLSIAGLLHGLYDVTVMIFVFAGFSLSSLAGYGFLHRERSRGRYAGAVVTGALIFFAVSNFGMWAAGGYYPQTAAGLAACYINGLPYLAQAALADSVYCFVLFGLHRLSQDGAVKLRAA